MPDWRKYLLKAIGFGYIEPIPSWHPSKPVFHDFWLEPDGMPSSVLSPEVIAYTSSVGEATRKHLSAQFPNNSYKGEWDPANTYVVRKSLAGIAHTTRTCVGHCDECINLMCEANKSPQAPRDGYRTVYTSR